MSTESTVLLLSTADTDLLAARASGADYRIGNPSRLSAADVPALLAGVDIAVVRLLGGKRAWEEGLAALRAAGVPTVLLGGESVPDAELMAESSVPAGVVAEALRYLVEGGPANLAELARFLSDTVLMSGEGFEPPREMPQYGVHGSYPAAEGRPTVGVLFYRAHELSGNTAFVDTLCEAIEAKGANALPVYCASLRDADAGLYELLGRADALVATVLAAGGSHASAASAGGVCARATSSGRASRDGPSSAPSPARAPRAGPAEAGITHAAIAISSATPCQRSGYRTGSAAGPIVPAWASACDFRRAAHGSFEASRNAHALANRSWVENRASRKAAASASVGRRRHAQRSASTGASNAQSG